MKRIILSEIENKYLISSLEALVSLTNDSDPVDKQWLDKLETTRKLLDLELSYYDIRKDGKDPTQKQMLQWLITKLKNRTADL